MVPKAFQSNRLNSHTPDWIGLNVSVVVWHWPLGSGHNSVLDGSLVEWPQVVESPGEASHAY